MARVSIKVPLEDLRPQPAAATPAASESDKEVPRSDHMSLSKKYLLYGLGILVALILVFVLLNDRRHLKQEVNKLSSTSQTTNAPKDALKYQEEIGKIVELPTGQTPSLIPVTDAAKLASENPFFKDAKNGDVVLLYVSADKSVRAILYRPSNHKVVEATSSATVGGGTAPSNTIPDNK